MTILCNEDATITTSIDHAIVILIEGGSKRDAMRAIGYALMDCGRLEAASLINAALLSAYDDKVSDAVSFLTDARLVLA